MLLCHTYALQLGKMMKDELFDPLNQQSAPYVPPSNDTLCVAHCIAAHRRSVIDPKPAEAVAENKLVFIINAKLFVVSLRTNTPETRREL